MTKLLRRIRAWLFDGDHGSDEASTLTAPFADPMSWMLVAGVGLHVHGPGELG